MKIGFVIGTAMIIFGAAVILLGGFRISKGYTISVRFNYVSGLEKGAPVRIAGMEVGEVRGLTIKGGKVESLLWLESSARVGKNTRISINSLGLIGDKYVDIPMANAGDEILKPGEIVNGIDPVNVEELLIRAETMVNKTEKIMVLMDKMLGGEETWERIDEITRDVKSISGDIKSLLSENKERLNSTIRNLESTSKSLNKTISTISENTNDINKTCKNFKEASLEFKGAIGKSSDKLHTTLSNLDELVTSLNDITDQIKGGKGVLGKAIVDPSMAKELTEAVSNLNALSKDLKANPWKLLQKK